MMDRTLLKLLENRCKLAIGSLSLVEKQLDELLVALDIEALKYYDDTLEGEKENSDSGFFITPPLSVYDEEVD